MDDPSESFAPRTGPTRQETGFDAGKKTKGVKQHILVDTLGLMLRIVIHPAGIQDRDGAALVMNRRARRRFPFIEVVFADQGYQGAKAADAISRTGKWRFEIVRREAGAKGFEVLPKRWIVERTLSMDQTQPDLAPCPGPGRSSSMQPVP